MRILLGYISMGTLAAMLFVPHGAQARVHPNRRGSNDRADAVKVGLGALTVDSIPKTRSTL
jgi:hypothetical protein